MQQKIKNLNKERIIYLIIAICVVLIAIKGVVQLLQPKQLQPFAIGHFVQRLGNFGGKDVTRYGYYLNGAAEWDSNDTTDRTGLTVTWDATSTKVDATIFQRVKTFRALNTKARTDFADFINNASFYRVGLVNDKQYHSWTVYAFDIRNINRAGQPNQLHVFILVSPDATQAVAATPVSKIEFSSLSIDMGIATENKVLDEWKVIPLIEDYIEPSLITWHKESPDAFDTLMNQNRILLDLTQLPLQYVPKLPSCHVQNPDCTILYPYPLYYSTTTQDGRFIYRDNYGGLANAFYTILPDHTIASIRNPYVYDNITDNNISLHEHIPPSYASTAFCKGIPLATTNAYNLNTFVARFQGHLSSLDALSAPHAEGDALEFTLPPTTIISSLPKNDPDLQHLFPSEFVYQPDKNNPDTSLPPFFFIRNILGDWMGYVNISFCNI